MSKPIWCPPDVWDKATAILHGYSVFTDGIQIATVAADIARAIMSAEKRGEERERAACELIAQDWTGGAEYIAAAIRKRGA